MIRPTIRVAIIIAALFAVFAPASVRAQDAEITQAILDFFFKARTAEAAEEDKVEDETKDVDARIAKFNECKKTYGVASGGGRMQQMAATALMKSKCGATNDDGLQKEKAALREGPEKAAVAAGGFKNVKEYRRIKDRLALYLGGNIESFNDNEQKLLASRKGDLSRMMGMAAAQRQSLTIGGVEIASGPDGERDARSGRSYRGRETRGLRGSGWNTNLAWNHISGMFETMYLSGAMMFEKPYKPGEWTRWELTESDVPDEKTIIERAMFAKTPEGAEWWRTKTINQYNEDGKAKADTVILESLFKNEDQYIRKLVRMRAKMPGKTESEELMVPENWSTWNMLAFPYKPTPESVEGATVGIEKVAGVDAKHVKFGGSNGGNMEWWLSDALPGGLARFRHTDDDVSGSDGKPVVWSMDLVAKGSGAKSELGVK